MNRPASQPGPRKGAHHRDGGAASQPARGVASGVRYGGLLPAEVNFGAKDMTTGQRRPLVAGNWKMNGIRASAAALGKIVQGSDALSKVDLLVCPPATLVMMFVSAAHGSKVAIGGQDCHAEPSGAFTGDISAEMLADAGATAVIVGHSERRTHHGASDGMVRAQA